jgi:NAD(P)-dependent dehydrogenase (short-subunit alcohol dehydrogenase family)
MELRDKVVVVTGGANGIGAALCRAFAGEGARTVVVADLDGVAAASVGGELGGTPVVAGVTGEADVRQLVDRAQEEHGPIDLFCANAGIGTMSGDEAVDEVWRRTWDVNVMAHVYAARALLPGWVARGQGYLLTTASAAGLLTQLGDAPYSVTKHAAVAFAEWVAIHYGDAGVKVSCLCPQGVRTNMLAGAAAAGEALLGANALDPSVVADVVVAGLRDERFLILPHPEVADYERRRADDRDRWLGGMRKLLRRISSM